MSNMASAPHPRVKTDSGPDAISVELSSRRTGMSFQRTRMSADRTLMSVIRTSLSLIGFGFTIYQVFEKLYEAGALKNPAAPLRFGQMLVWAGIGMLCLGIAYHVAFMIGLRRLRDDLKRDGLIHGESHFPASLTLMVALALLTIGVFAISSMSCGAGPFEVR
jgi:putative membrane protein